MQVGPFEFGNTGFDIHFGSGGNAFDFMPEGKRHSVKEPPVKYASFLGAGFLELYKLLNDKEMISKFGLDKIDTSRMSAQTNDYLTYAIKNLFSQSSVEDIVRADYIKHIVEVNLDAFKNLKKSDPFSFFGKSLRKSTQKYCDISKTHYLINYDDCRNLRKIQYTN
jgi:hypothetical protein